VTPSRPVFALSHASSAIARRAVAPLLVALLALGGCASEEERIADFLERGDAYVAEGKDEEAIIEYKNVLQLAPDHPKAHFALSKALLRADKPRDAYWEMSESVRVDPENIEARLRYGTISAAIGDYDLSLEQANAVLELDPDNARGLNLRAQALEQREDYEGALSDLKAAIEADPDAAAFRFLLAGFYERRGDPETAEATYRELLDVEESYMAAAALARVVLRERSRYGEGEALLDRAIELADEAPTEPREIAPGEESEGTTSLFYNVLREDALLGAYTTLSTLRYDQGDFDGAIAALEEGLSKSAKGAPYIYQMARLYRAEGRTEDEQRMMRRATEAAPDSVDAQLVLSTYLGQQGDLDGALEAAEAAVAADPENESALLREAELRIDLGFRDGLEESVRRGRELVDRVLARRPDSPEANFVKAKIELAEGDVESAKRSLETTLTARPTWAQARFVLGSALARQGDLSRARVELEAAIENMPSLNDARRLLVQVYAQLGEHEFAIEEGRTYLRDRPGEIQIRILVGQSLIRVGRAEEAYEEIAKIPDEQRDEAALFALGRLDLAYGRIEEGAAKLRRAEELAPGNPQVLRSLLAVDVQKKRIDESVKRIERALEVKPDDSELVELHAEVMLLQKKRDEARTALLRAVELDPRNVSAQMALADLEMQSGNATAALEVVERAAAALPESADVQFRLAQAYDGNGRRADAMRAYDKTIALNPDLVMAKNNLAYLLAEEGGDLDRALELAQSAKEQLPDDGNVADTLGWVLLKRGLPSAAIGYLEEAAEQFPENAFEVQGIVHNHLAIAYEANDEPDKALAESRAVIGYYQQLTKAAASRGIEVGEPTWLQETRERLARLEPTAS
jgi:tetratricopeptide (TPR) repeat protein